MSLFILSQKTRIACTCYIMTDPVNERMFYIILSVLCIGTGGDKK